MYHNNIGLELNRILELLKENKELLSQVEQEAGELDSSAANNDLRSSKTNKYYVLIREKITDKHCISDVTLSLFLAYCFGLYWPLYPDLHTKVNDVLPNIKHQRTKGIRGEADYLTACLDREIRLETIVEMKKLKTNNWDDPYGKTFKKLGILKGINDINTKQSRVQKIEILRYKELVDDNPYTETETLDENNVKLEISKSFDVLKNAMTKCIGGADD